MPVAAGPDVVYIVGPGGGGDELRHSLRSLDANVEHGQVWIVGDAPAWARNVEHLPTRQDGSRFTNSTGNVRAACAHPDISDTFTLWNDDFFALAPTVVPIWHGGAVVDVRRGDPNRQRRQATYVDGLAATAWLLRRWGHERILNYDLHVPMPVRSELMLEVLDAAAPYRIAALHKRTLYGNAAELEGEQHADVKIGTAGGNIKPGQLWASSSDRSFARGRLGEQLRLMFPTPCRYEQEGA